MVIEWYGPVFFVKTGGKKCITEESGVYIIAEEIGGKEYVRYIGQSKNISDRIKEHKSDSETNSKLHELMTEKRYEGVRVYTTIECDSTRINNLEYTAITYFGGTQKLFNEKIPEGRYLENINYPGNLI